MAIEIREVKTNRELNVFINFPHTLYKGNKYYTPHLHFDEKATLDKRKNPAFDFCEARYWLAYKDQKPVGRIAGILNKAFISKGSLARPKMERAAENIERNVERNVTTPRDRTTR